MYNSGKNFYGGRKMKKSKYTVILSIILFSLLPAFRYNAEKISEAHINVPYINQNKLVSGCEAVSGTMVLNFWGYNISEEDFYDNYLIRKDWRYGKDGSIYAPDPNSAYVGNARIKSGINCGFGCYSNALQKSLKKVIDSSKHKSLNTTGADIAELCSKYIDNNIPVIIWATIGMVQSRPTCKWIISYIDKNSKFKLGDNFTWIAHEHCLVLTGYNDNYYFCNDPYKNSKNISIDKRLLERRFKELGMQSVVVVPIYDIEESSHIKTDKKVY